MNYIYRYGIGIPHPMKIFLPRLIPDYNVAFNLNLHIRIGGRLPFGKVDKQINTGDSPKVRDCPSTLIYAELLGSKPPIRKTGFV